MARIPQEAMDVLQGKSTQEEASEQSEQSVEVEQEEPSEEFDVDAALAAEDDQQEGVEPNQDVDASDLEDTLDQSEQGAATSESGDVEYIVAAGQKIKIDYSDKDAIKDAHRKAAGMRKAFSKADKLQKEIVAERKAHSELKEVWNKLEAAYSEHGVGGVIETLTNGQETLDSFLEKEMQKRKFLDEATPEELEAYEARELANKKERENERLRKEWDEFRAKMEAKDEEAEVKSLESIMHPAFDQYSYTGKLEDPVAEQVMNETLWNNTIKRLDKYPDNVELTPAIIRKEFRTVANTLNKVISKKAEKQANEITTERKRQAKEAAQLAITNRQSGNSKAKELAKKIRSGNVKDILFNWDEYGSMFK